MQVSIAFSFLAQYHDALLAVMILSCCIMCQISSERAGDFPACGLALISPTSNFNTELREIEKGIKREKERERERECGSSAIVSQMQNVNERRITKCASTRRDRLSVRLLSRYSFKFAISRVIITFGRHFCCAEFISDSWIR